MRIPPAVAKCAAVTVLVAAAFVVPSAAWAQRPVALRVAADNDAFEFWIPPWDRPDQEYTSGVRGTIEYRGRFAARPFRWLLRDAAASTTHSYGIGQAIYTAASYYPDELVDPSRGGPTYADLHRRPNGAWLYLTFAERDSVDGGTSRAGFDIGVVGPPALGRPMQKFFHSLGPQYQREVDWSRQLPTEPGFVAHYDRERFAGTFRNGAWRGTTTVSAGGSLGTILTEARAAVRQDARAQAGSVGFTVAFDALAHGIVRDEFLDGTFFKKGDDVARNAFALDGSLGVTAQWREWAMTYRGTRGTKRYAAQPRSLSWGTLELEWRPSR